MGRRKQRGSREAVLAKGRAPAKECRPQTSAALADRPTLPPANPPRRNVPLLICSIALFLVWLVVLVILARYR